ncbi:hypothetical protein BGZ96_005949, partial [Linnemannia gamsii]
MLARTYITYVAVAVFAIVSMTSAAPTVPADVPALAAEAQEIISSDFLQVPKEMSPKCCAAKISPCCISE